MWLFLHNFSNRIFWFLCLSCSETAQPLLCVLLSSKAGELTDEEFGSFTLLMCVYLKQNVSCEVCFLLFASGVIICVSDSYEFFLIWLWLWPCRNQYLSPVVSQDSKDLSWKLMQARTFKQELSLNPAPCCLCVSHITRKSQFQYWFKEQNLPAYNILLLRWTGCRQSCFKTKNTFLL